MNVQREKEGTIWEYPSGRKTRENAKSGVQKENTKQSINEPTKKRREREKEKRNPNSGEESRLGGILVQNRKEKRKGGGAQKSHENQAKAKKRV